MRYLLMINFDPDAGPEDGTPEQERLWDAYNAFTRELAAGGRFLAANALHPPSTATTVRVRDDEVLITDGPFAETKEQIGGFYLVECADLDEAIELARRCPGSWHGTVEVRPVQPHELEDSGELARLRAEADARAR